mgnify:CR=1 FL=1
MTDSSMTGARLAAAAPLHDPAARGFASDNYAGIHPEVLYAIARANGGHPEAYGADGYSPNLNRVFRRQFGDHAAASPVLNGTGSQGLRHAALPRT